MLPGGEPEESVAKRVPSAKADSILPTLLPGTYVPGLSRCRRCAAGAWFIPLTGTISEFRNTLWLIPLTVTITEFLNCLRRALSYMMRGGPEGRPYIGAQPTNL